MIYLTFLLSADEKFLFLFDSRFAWLILSSSESAPPPVNNNLIFISSINNIKYKLLLQLLLPSNITN